MLNVVAIEIRLTADPELRYTPDGTAVCNFTGAHNLKFKDTEKASFIRFVAWRRQAEVIAEYCSKGSRLALSGYLQSRSWEQEGQTRYVTEVVIRSLSLPDKNGNGMPKTKAPPEDTPLPTDEDDIPF